MLIAAVLAKEGFPEPLTPLEAAAGIGLVLAGVWVAVVVAFARAWARKASTTRR